MRDALAPNGDCFKMDLNLDGAASVAEFDESLLFAVVARDDVVVIVVVAVDRELAVDGVRDAVMAGFLVAVDVGKSMGIEITGLLMNFRGVTKSYRFVVDGANSLLFNVDEIKSYGLMFVCKIDRCDDWPTIAPSISLADARPTVAFGIKFRCDRPMPLFADVAPLTALRNKRDVASLLTSGIDFR